VNDEAGRGAGAGTGQAAAEPQEHSEETADEDAGEAVELPYGGDDGDRASSSCWSN
jgi:hypothetical protein